MIKRISKLPDIIDKGSSVLLLGPRGVGKTALVQRILASKTIVFEINLLLPEAFTRYLLDPEKFILDVEARLPQHKTERLYVFIDEVQKVPVLLDSVHHLLEKHKKKVQFLVTGSSARKLKRGHANLTAGRLISVSLHPFTHLEWKSRSWEQQLQLGSIPSVVFDNQDQERTLRSYVHTYLKEEILEESLIRKVEAFTRFLEVAAQYHCEPMDASAIAKIAHVSPNTIISYFNILKDTLMCFELPGWSASVTKQLRTTPKVYLFDNGVVNVLRGEIKIELKESSSRFGKLFEAYIIQEAFRLNDYEELDLRFSYWLTNNEQEIDLIVSRGRGQPLASIEIKSGTEPADKDFSAFKGFSENYPKVPRYCFCRTPTPYETPLGVKVLPWEQGLALLKNL